MKKTMKLMATAALVAISSQATVVLDYNFNGTAAGTTVRGNTAQYDYTSDQVYVGTNAVANTLAFNGKSSGTDYIIRDKGLGHENALYLKTLNTINADFGIYLQKLDFTDGGANAANTTRVTWSFDILAYDSNGNIDPTGWTVKVRTDNNSQSINVSDAWFTAGVLGQTFSFNDDSSGETATDGTWTTISGSYDIAAGTGGSVGGIQISTDNGGYTSAGGIFLDNITVDVTTIPEPATLGMIALFGAGTIFIRRRFMI